MCGIRTHHHFLDVCEPPRQYLTMFFATKFYLFCFILLPRWEQTNKRPTFQSIAMCQSFYVCGSLKSAFGIELGYFWEQLGCFELSELIEHLFCLFQFERVRKCRREGPEPSRKKRSWSPERFEPTSIIPQMDPDHAKPGLWTSSSTETQLSTTPKPRFQNVSSICYWQNVLITDPSDISVPF